MSRYIEGENRNQLSLEPMCFDDMIPENAEVRAIEIIVEKMDIKALGFTHSETKQTGRKPYNPVDMFKLYTYSYFNGIRSSRKIEKECSRNIELMWLIGNLRPDFKTIADFRRDNKEQIKLAFKRFSLICDELGLIGKEIVAVDGSKFRASNGRLSYHSEKKLNEKIKHHTKVAEEYLKLLDAYDNEEKNQPKLAKEKIAEKIDKVNKRIAELSELKEVVKQKGTIYETDPDSRMMKTNNHGADICHNVQIAVDDKNHLVVAADVISEPVDKEQLHNISFQAKENMQVDEITVIADKGYYSSSQFKQCTEDKIIPIVSKANHNYRAVTEEYSKESFYYDNEKGGYVCPQGALLLPYNPTSKKTDSLVYRNLKACSNCSSKDKCTTNKKGRTMHEQPFAEYAREVDKRTKENMEMYKKRKQLVEHPWGTVKRAFGFSYFLTRGTESVRAESALHFLVYNMKRVINLVGVSGLKVGV